MNFIPKSLIEDAKNINTRKSITSKRTIRQSNTKLPNRASIPRHTDEIHEEVNGDNPDTETGLDSDSPRQSTGDVKYDPTSNRYSYTARQSDLGAPRISTVPPVPRISEIQPISEESKLITRRQVVKLREMMDDLLKSFDQQEYSTDMDVFIGTIREETKIYESVFMEIIKQVSVQMIERGEILNEIRIRYSDMFRRIPERVVGMYNDLGAHRRLNRRLKEELQRAQQNISELVVELNSVKEIGVPLPMPGKDVDSNLDDFYKTQIDRLKISLERSEKEKKLWILATTNLAMRISDNYSMRDLQSIFKCEEGRVRTTNHISSIIRLSNTKDYKEIEECVIKWQDEVGPLSKEISDLDCESEHALTTIKTEFKKISFFLKVNSTDSNVDENHELLKDFKEFDLNFLKEKFKNWNEKLSKVYCRYSKQNEAKYRAHLARCRDATRIWAETGFKVLRRYEGSTCGEEFKTMRNALRIMQVEIYDWFDKLEIVINGDDGISNNLLIVKTEVEDVYHNVEKLEIIENLKREGLIKSMESWEVTIDSLASKFGKNTCSEQFSIPQRILNWMEKIYGRMNQDYDSRSEGTRLVYPLVTVEWHNDLIDWVVNILLPGQTESYSISAYRESLFKRVLGA